MSTENAGGGSELLGKLQSKLMEFGIGFGAGESGEGDKVYKETGDRIRRIRNQMGYTQSAFARELGLDRMTVTRMENGYSTSIDVYIKVAKYLNVSLDYLLRGKDDKIVNLRQMVEELIETLTLFSQCMCDADNATSEGGEKSGSI